MAQSNPTSPEAIYGKSAKSFTLATGSPGELGLLQALGEAFDKKEGARLVWIKAGSGASLKLLKNAQVDMIMVHAPDAVNKAIAEGWAVNRTLIGSNEFYIVGPKNDPASIKIASSGADAYLKIANTQSKFISRGDNSGTHQKEIDIWKKTGITPNGSWYIVTNDFMTASLKKANAEDAYFMTDSSTWVAEKDIAPNLQILYRGDPFLVNTYDALAAPVGATANRDIAVKFIQFVSSNEGQKIIRDYGKSKHREPLYNDATYAKQYAH
ncbi:substrate-binding domain-containing protein [Polynucleobacter sp. MWH-UH19D]|uniref:substrate-binding domain-containing protein n=1 Tax=Polynucleobacter sp. MWH-UH19D TaxID=1855610 RepID=UPI003364CF68